jgi:uncharacterized protein (DUF2141 family)
LALLAVCLVGSRAHAQDPPARLPAVVINARPNLPGANKLAGVVRDTMANALDGAEVAIPSVQRRIFAGVDGAFRFEDLKPGKYQVRARKIGFAPQVQSIVVDDSGGVSVFNLVPMPRSLAPVVSSAARGGLSGTVGDTAYRPIAGATIRVLANGASATTDSLGAFFIPLRAGTYAASVMQRGYEFRLVSVTIPPDSGRAVTVFLAPLAKPVSHEQAANLFEFERRLELRSRNNSRVFTHAELEQMGVEWGLDAVRRGVGAVATGRSATWVDPDCSVIVNGGPKIVNLNTLTIDDIELVEIYPGSQNPGAMPLSANARTGRGSRASPPAVAPTAQRLAAWSNATKACPTVYVWVR